MITDDHLTGFRTVHAGFRLEFGRLAVACRAVGSDMHARLLDEQIALVLDVLHKHHHHEDEHLWPELLCAEPDAADELAALEAEHEVLDPLIATAADRERGWAERADALEQLHRTVNEHLDHEERVAFPLMRAHRTPEDMEADRRKASAEFGRRRLPLIFGWLASCSDEPLLLSALDEQPRLARILFRRFWWPSYQRRFHALYGAGAAIPNSLPVAA